MLEHYKGSESTKQTFRQLCESSLSVTDFNNLPQSIGMKKYTITIAFKSPNKMTFDLLKCFATVLKISPFYLAITYGCSLDEMTAREYMSIAEQAVKEVQEQEKESKNAISN